MAKAFQADEGFDDPHSAYLAQQNAYYRTLPNMILSSTSGLPGFDKAIQSADPTGVGRQPYAVPDPNGIFRPDVAPSLADLAKQCSSSSLDDLISATPSQAGLGCGWMYTPPVRGSPTPVLSQGAMGDAKGPVHLKDLPSYKKWFFDLQEAKRTTLLDKCKALTTCAGATAECGWCMDTNQGVPIDAAGRPLYTDPRGTCTPSSVVKDPAACPAPPAGPQPVVDRTCEPQSGRLSVGCLTRQVLSAGCTDRGALAIALNMGSPSNYLSAVEDGKAMTVYQRVAHPPLALDVFRQGATTVDRVLAEVRQLAANTTQPTNSAIGAAARDLCLQRGAINGYNDCFDLPDSQPAPFDLGCLQKIFLKMGGQPAGTAYPSTANIAMYNAMGTLGAVKQTWGDMAAKMREGFANASSHSAALRHEGFANASSHSAALRHEGFANASSHSAALRREAFANASSYSAALQREAFANASSYSAALQREGFMASSQSAALQREAFADYEAQRTAMTQFLGITPEAGIKRAPYQQGIEVFWFVCVPSDPKRVAGFLKRTIERDWVQLRAGPSAIAQLGGIAYGCMLQMTDVRVPTDTKMQFGVLVDDGFWIAVNQPADIDKRAMMQGSADEPGLFENNGYQGPTQYDSKAVTPYYASKPNITKMYYQDCGGGWNSFQLTMRPAAFPASQYSLTCEAHAPFLTYEVGAKGAWEELRNPGLFGQFLGVQAPEYHLRPEEKANVPGKKAFMRLNGASSALNMPNIAFQSWRTMTFAVRLQSMPVKETLCHVFMGGVSNESFAIVALPVSGSTSAIQIQKMFQTNGGNMATPWQLTVGTWYVFTVHNRKTSFEVSCNSVEGYLSTRGNASSVTVSSNGAAMWKPNATWNPTPGQNAQPCNLLFGGGMFQGQWGGVYGSSAFQVDMAWVHFFDREAGAEEIVRECKADWVYTAFPDGV